MSIISVLYSFPERQWAAWLGFRRCVSAFLTSHPTAGDTWQRQSVCVVLARCDGRAMEMISDEAALALGRNDAMPHPFAAAYIFWN